MQKFSMEKAKSVSMPVDTGTKLVKTTGETDGVDRTFYQSAVGSLLYLSIGTRPDIIYAVSNVTKLLVSVLSLSTTCLQQLFDLWVIPPTPRHNFFYEVHD